MALDAIKDSIDVFVAKAASGDTNRVVVAVAEDDDEVVLGWCAYQLPNKVHFAYVKQIYRNEGVGTALLKHAKSELGGSLVYTMHPRCTYLLKSEGKDLRYAPEQWNP